jgi:thioesterase domain-containing protein
LDRPWREKAAYLFQRLVNLRTTVLVRERLASSIAQAQTMHENYLLRKYPGRAVVVLAEDSFFNVARSRDPRRYLEKLATGGVDYISCPGDHHSILSEPHAAALGTIVKDALRSSQAIRKITPVSRDNES